MNHHQVGLQEWIEACAEEERRCGLERVEREGDQQQGQAHEVHETKAPSVHVHRTFSLPRKRSAPQPSHQRHPPEPHQQWTFTGSPRGCKPVLERQILASKGGDVEHGGVVDKEQTGQRNEGKGHGQMEDDGERRLLFVETGFDQQPNGGAEGQPHRQPPHEPRVMGDRQRALVIGRQQAVLTNRRIWLVNSQRRAAPKSHAWSAAWAVSPEF